MTRLPVVKRQLSRVWLWSAIVTIAVFSLANIPIARAQPVSINTSRDCDSNAVIFCGAGSINQLTDKVQHGDGHNSAADIQAIYNSFGISMADIMSMSSGSVQVESGLVTKAGNVLGDKNNNLLATNALTGGRQNLAGSSRHMIGGKPFFTRSPSVSFQSNALSAFVVIINGKFAFAILSSCGNPVKATPFVTPPPTPAPTPVVTPATVSVCSGNTSNTATTTASSSSAAGTAQGGNCSTNIVNNTVTTPGSPTCDMLGLSLGANRMATISNFMTTANGGTLTSVDINWGDGTTMTGVTNPIGQMHQFAADGTFTVSVAAHFMVNGQDVVANGNVCQQQVSFNTPTPTVPPPTPVTPAATSTPAAPVATPQTLVNTGAGNVIGLFGVATTAGALSYRLLIIRRLKQPY